jgi:dihydroorotate dehydrogenase
MAFLYKNVALPLIDALTFGDAETAHELAIWALRNAGQGVLENQLAKKVLPKARGLGTMVGDMFFPNPLGLAAGFDKDGTAARALEFLDFGFIVSGTVTFEPQIGNSRPRLFRLRKDEAIINRYGFNSCGAWQFKENIRVFGRPSVPFGISIGPNKTSVEADQSTRDLVFTIRIVYECADFFVVNVSSPNTPGLRALQDPKLLAVLLKEVLAELRQMQRNYAQVRRKPLWVKLAPDLTMTQLDETVGTCVDAGVEGVIFGNTTINKKGLNTKLVEQVGGLSGHMLFERMCYAMKFIDYRYPGLPKMGVGGINSAERANRALDSGANLIKIHTALVTEGPMVPSRITRGLWRRGYTTDHAEAPVEYKIAA